MHDKIDSKDLPGSTSGATLAALQADTDRALRKLERASRKLERTLARYGLDDPMTIEEHAYSVLYYRLREEFGWKVGVLKRGRRRWEGRRVELNLLGAATDPADPGQTIWIVGEAKRRLTLRDVDRFVRKVEVAQRNLAGTVFPVCFCYRARPEAQEQIRETRIALLFSNSTLVRPGERSPQLGYAPTPALGPSSGAQSQPP